jgi:hypothetical protein
MYSDILACERTTYPVLLECLKYPGRDVRPLQLVNKSMCAAYRHFKDQVDEHTAKRERMLHAEAATLATLTLATIEIVMSALDRPLTFIHFLNPVERPPTHMQQRTASSGALLLAAPVIDLEPRNEPRMVSYSNNIFDNSFNNSFVRGFRIFNAAQLATGAAVDTAVIEVD